MSLTIPAPLVKDGLDLAVFATTAVQTAVDSMLGKTQAEIPQLTGDAVSAVESVIEQHVPEAATAAVQTILAVGGPEITSAESAVDVATVAALHTASASLAAALAHLTKFL